MSESTHEAHAGEHHAEAEPDSTNVAMLGFIVAVTAAVLVVTVWGLDVYFTRETEALKFQKIYSVGNPDLDALRGKEKAWLEGYGVVDREKGLYSIPIDQGMKVFAREAEARAQAGEPQRIGPEVPPPGAVPAPGATPVPAPTGGVQPTPGAAVGGNPSPDPGSGGR
jgi:hypothetical protein